MLTLFAVIGQSSNARCSLLVPPMSRFGLGWTAKVTRLAARPRATTTDRQRSLRVDAPVEGHGRRVGRARACAVLVAGGLAAGERAGVRPGQMPIGARRPAFRSPSTIWTGSSPSGAGGRSSWSGPGPSCRSCCGLVDRLEAAGSRRSGPPAAAARLEGPRRSPRLLRSPRHPYRGPSDVRAEPRPMRREPTFAARRPDRGQGGRARRRQGRHGLRRPVDEALEALDRRWPRALRRGGRHGRRRGVPRAARRPACSR